MEKLRAGWFFLVALLFSHAALAEDMVAKESVKPFVVSGTSYIGQVIMGLMAVLLLILALAWLLKRFGQSNLLTNQHMKIIAAMPLGTRDRLVLVDVAGQQLLLGLSPGNITNLHTFTEPAVLLDTDSGRPDFASKLREMMQKGKQSVQVDGSMDQVKPKKVVENEDV